MKLMFTAKEGLDIEENDRRSDGMHDNFFTSHEFGKVQCTMPALVGPRAEFQCSDVLWPPWRSERSDARLTFL